MQGPSYFVPRMAIGDLLAMTRAVLNAPSAIDGQTGEWYIYSFTKHFYLAIVPCCRKPCWQDQTGVLHLHASYRKRINTATLVYFAVIPLTDGQCSKVRVLSFDCRSPLEVSVEIQRRQQGQYLLPVYVLASSNYQHSSQILTYLDIKVCILGAITDITGSNHVDTSTKASIVDGCNNRLFTFFNSCESALEPLMDHIFNITFLRYRALAKLPEDDHDCYKSFLLGHRHP